MLEWPVLVKVPEKKAKRKKIHKSSEGKYNSDESLRLTFFNVTDLKALLASFVSVDIEEIKLTWSFLPRKGIAQFSCKLCFTYKSILSDAHAEIEIHP